MRNTMIVTYTKPIKNRRATKQDIYKVNEILKQQQDIFLRMAIEDFLKRPYIYSSVAHHISHTYTKDNKHIVNMYKTPLIEFTAAKGKIIQNETIESSFTYTLLYKDKK